MRLADNIPKKGKKGPVILLSLFLLTTKVFDAYQPDFSLFLAYSKGGDGKKRKNEKLHLTNFPYFFSSFKKNISLIKAHYIP